jgi:sugar lactone lactonase YvrE
MRQNRRSVWRRPFSGRCEVPGARLVVEGVGMQIRRVGDFTLVWGESLVWDDRRDRLFFVDCAAQTLHWLEGGDGELHTMQMPSMPAGIVPTDDGLLVGLLADGLHVIDAEAGTTRLVATYPAEIDGRCNDACADLHGNLITGKLNLGPAEGSAWWFNDIAGWRVLDRDISNTNGPAAGVLDGEMTLIIGDTSADYFSYPYTPETGTVGERSVFGDVSELVGHPDGSTLDAEGGLWCALFAGAQLVRFVRGRLERALPMPVANPTDVTFGGPDLDRLYVVSIGAQSGSDSTGLDGALIVVDGLAVPGRLEPRFSR